MDGQRDAGTGAADGKGAVAAGHAGGAGAAGGTGAVAAGGARGAGNGAGRSRAMNGAAGSAGGEMWWRGGVIYQIYIRSFADGNGDGSGDLAGAASRLEHIARLGADAVWITPFYPSPMEDFGYDVSDYCGVDPLFGTLGDFDALLEKAHGLGLKVMIDLVLSHTSDRHPWFDESRAAASGPKADWYVWADAKPDGGPPNNWLSVFGGSAWAWEGRRGQYYLHNFLASQPDLNFHNREVQDALLEVARFWLARGVDGFRLDTVNFYFHDAELRDNPPLAPELRSERIAPAVNPYNHQEHLYDRNRPETPLFLERLRAVMDEGTGRAAVGEIGDAICGAELARDYTAGGRRLHMCYDFELLAPGPVTPDGIAEALARSPASGEGAGWPCRAFSNHDVARHATRMPPASWGRERAARLLASVLLSLDGSVCIYQGEELGLPEAEVPFEALQDPYGKEFWPEFAGRDGCRTPMPWAKDDPLLGFGKGVGAGMNGVAAPWLPPAETHRGLAVDAQEKDEGSVLAHYRRLLALRARSPALRTGGLELLALGPDLLAFRRGASGAGGMLCLFNFADEPREALLPDGDWRPLPESDEEAELAGSRALLPPCAALWVQDGAEEGGGDGNKNI